ncbi:MAG: hypothetical protein F4X14_19030 [Caldilineaceae bacterium SB0661_bin_32]|uniref:SF3 helicase domain-containing protein n=1 Tax=Caldilineaceae bacterium SB0661_bin_32 TaxID=2605255 RepID=A0A6B1DBS3_9CHLR|nr:hypothetical protein [Caldilineaceae bacterium SB0661_bin_32]
MQRQFNSTTDSFFHGSFSLFPRVTARKPVGTFSLPELEAWIRRNESPAGNAQLPDLRSMTNAIRAHYRQHGKDERYQAKKRALPAFTPAGLFSRRNAAGLEQHSGYIPVDFDALPSEEKKRALLEQLRQLPFIALAALSVADGTWVLAAVDPAPANAREHTTAWRAVVDAVQERLVNTQVDKSGKDLARGRYLAADPNVYVNRAAMPLPWSSMQEVRRPRPSVGKQALPSAAEVELMLTCIDPDCDRTTWIKIGAALRREGYDLSQWRNWSAQGRKFDPDKDCTVEEWEGLAHYGGREARIGSIIKLAREGGYRGHLPGALGLRAEIQEETDPGASFPAELNRIHEKLSELHHVRRMLERHAPDLLSAVDVDTRTLYVLQRNGIWLPGDDQVRRLYWATASHWLRLVVEHRDLLPSLVDNDKAFADTVKAFRATERNRACKEGIQLAGSMIAHWEKQAAAPAAFHELTLAKKAELDADLRYLGCENGVIDLHTGDLLSAAQARDKLVTRSTGVLYSSQARHPAVDKLTAHLSDAHREWLLSAVGYALRGYPDRTLYLLVGPPGGGKSTFLTAVRLALGQYADALAEGALTQRNVNSATAGLSPEMEPFTRCRVVIDSDLESSATLSTGRLKKLAGGDEMKWRGLHSGFGDTRRVTATMFISLNDDQAPSLTMDSGLYERLRPLPYPAIPADERDPGLRAALEQPEAREAMLALLVRHAVKTGRPPAVSVAVGDLRERLRRESVGAGFHDWATAALTVTNRPVDKVSTADLWASAVKAAGTDSPWGYNRRTFVTALRSLLDLAPTAKIWAEGKVVNGWVGVRFAAVEEGEAHSAGEAFSEWVDAHMARTGNAEDRVSTVVLWELLVEAGGDPPWGYTRREAFATFRGILDLPPARKVRIDGRAVNGWQGVRVVKGGDSEASSERS